MASEQETIASWEYGKNLAVETRPTGRIKWFPRSMMQAHNLELYQEYEVRRYDGGKPHSRSLEWRKVETGSLDELNAQAN